MLVFLDILSQSVETSCRPGVFESAAAWRLALPKSDVRHQWDPDRTLLGEPMERRAIQIGIRGPALRQYVNEWIIGLEEVTELAKEVQRAVRENGRPCDVPVEREYKVNGGLANRLGM